MAGILDRIGGILDAEPKPVYKVTVSPEVRQQNLDAAIHKQARRGWKLLTRTETQAQMVFGRPPSHVLHLLLSLITVGLWIPVWILVGLFGGEKTQLLKVDEFGTVR